MVSNIKYVAITTTVVTVILSGVVLYFVKKRKRENRIPNQWKKIGYVQKILIFPLKSAHYVDIDAAECTEVGLRLSKGCLKLRDRSFAVYDAVTGEIKYCAVIPVLVQIKVAVHDNDVISLNAPKMDTIMVRIPSKSQDNKCFVKDYYGDPIEAADCGEEVARWLSQHISQKDVGYRLAYHDGSQRRKFVKNYKELRYYEHLTDAATGLFAGLTSILVLNQASVDDYLRRAQTSEVTAMNFRPNIIIDGPGLNPFDEHGWEWLKIGEDTILRNVKDCVRCIVTTVHPETGARIASREPLTTLSKYRMNKGPEKAPLMGIHMEVKKTGLINSGDAVYHGHL